MRKSSSHDQAGTMRPGAATATTAVTIPGNCASRAARPPQPPPCRQTVTGGHR